jgi:hypothetical protein
MSLNAPSPEGSLRGFPVRPAPIFGAFLSYKPLYLGGDIVQEVYYSHTVQVNCTQTALKLHHGMRQGEVTCSPVQRGILGNSVDDNRL